MQFVKIPLSLAVSLSNAAVGLVSLAALQAVIDAAPKLTGTLDAVRRLAVAGGRDICGIDIEATGVNATQDRIIELSVVKVKRTGGTEARTWMVNPGINIPVEASAVHGIFDADVRAEDVFSGHVAEIYGFLAGCDIAGFSSNSYDVPMLCQHFDEAGVDWPAMGTRQYDAAIIFRQQAPRTLSAAVLEYTGEPLSDAHRAEADTLATLAVLAAQLEREPMLAALTPDELHAASCYNAKQVDVGGKLVLNEAGEVTFNFGTHKGKAVLSEPSYARWMLRSDFPNNTKRHLERVLDEN